VLLLLEVVALPLLLLKAAEALLPLLLLLRAAEAMVLTLLEAQQGPCCCSICLRAVWSTLSCQGQHWWHHQRQDRAAHSAQQLPHQLSSYTVTVTVTWFRT